jgi:hypothetical protein
MRARREFEKPAQKEVAAAATPAVAPATFKNFRRVDFIKAAQHSNGWWSQQMAPIEIHRRAGGG